MTKESIRNQRVLIKTWKQIKKCVEHKNNANYWTDEDYIAPFSKDMKYLCGRIITLNGLTTLNGKVLAIHPWMVQEIISTQEKVETKVEFYDKQPIYFWDDWKTHEKHLGFWDERSKRSFLSDGTRAGHNWDNYEAVLDNQIPSWMVEAQKTLEEKQ